MHSPSPHTVTGPITTAPAHSARPRPPRAARLVVLAAVALLAFGLGVAVQESTGSPFHSTPPSALHMNDAPPGP